MKDTLEDKETDEKGRELANAQISQLAEDSVTEARIESLIKAKGYQDAVVFLGEDSVNVIIAPPSAGLPDNASKIRDIVMRKVHSARIRLKSLKQDEKDYL